MKLLYDFFPLLLFFIVYKTYNIFAATGVLIAASAIQVAYLWFKYKRIEPMHLMTFLLVLIFGGATIWLHDVMFLKWKVSIVNWLFACAFLLSEWLAPKNIIRYLMEANIKLPMPVWRRLNLIWALFFLLMGFINLYVMYHFSTSIWVDFKVFGMLGLTLLFIIIQSAYLFKYIKENN